MLIRKKFNLTLILTLAALILTFSALICFNMIPAMAEVNTVQDLFRTSMIPPYIPLWAKFLIFTGTVICFLWAFVNLCTFRPRVLRPMLEATRFCRELGNGRYPVPFVISAEQNAEMNELLKSLNIIRDRLLSSANRLRSSHNREAEARRISENNAELKSMLISRIVPEVRSPLNNMAGYAELLGMEEALRTAPGSEYLDGIRRSVKMMLRYLERFQRIGGFGQSGSSLTIRTFRTEELLQQLKEQNEFPLFEHSQKLQTPFLSEMPEYLRTDQERLQQLLSLMVRGVARAAGTGAEIRCVCVRTPEGVEFRVSDTGKTPCREKLVTLYNHFRRDSALSELGDAGTAVLGMIFIDAQAAVFGGRLIGRESETAHNEFVLFFAAADIAADDSRENRTQTFHITDMPQYSGAAALPEDEYDGRDYSVLIGEEDPDSARILERLLQGNHFRTCCAAKEEEVLKRCSSGKYDAVVLSQPRRGWDLPQLIRELLRSADDPNFPVMVLANEDTALKRRELNRAGARCILLKPLDFLLMVRQLRGICRRN